ncbi:unnamed protein product [Urochloa humidicola]
MASAEGSSPGQYVKLRKEKEGDAPAAGTETEDIRPGELNQAVRVPELEVQKCEACRQVLPPGFHPPADEAWSTGIFGCAEDCESCWTGLLCPCVLFGRNVEAVSGVPWTEPCAFHAVCIEGGIALSILTAAFHGVTSPVVSYLIGEGLLCGWMLCTAGTSLSRERLQKKYHLMDSPCNSWLVHCTLHWCAICQEHRESKAHLPAQRATPATIVKPPLVQEMSMSKIPSSTTAPENEAPKTGHDNFEVVPL